MKTITAFFLAAAMALALRAAATGEKTSYCAACHQDQASVEMKSVHANADLGCTGCHGGDPSAEYKEAAKGPGTGYRGIIERTSIPGLCGDCHADVRVINPYGLPTDQLAQYRVSMHGEKLFGEGNVDVATCADCHGAHGILTVRDPESPVFPQNVPSTCGHCHSDAGKMGKYGLEANEEDLYRQSVHAEMLFDQNDLSAPTCVTCHGNHGAVPPGFAKVGLVCGKCHIKQVEYFNQGPHAVPAEAGDIETCITCHGNHKIQRASERLFKVCTLCHDKGTEQIERAAEIYRMLTESQKNFDEAASEVDAAARAGFDTEDEQLMMGDARTYLLQLQPMQHSLDLAKLKDVGAKAEQIVGQVKSDIEKKRVWKRRRKLALIPLSGFMASMSLLFWLKKRQISRGG